MFGKSIESVNNNKTLKRRRQTSVTDWSGRLLNKRALNLLCPGCFVRICVSNTKTGNSEALYFEIIKIKDGTFWGITQDTYRIDDYVGLSDESVFTFRKKDISEIPISWQPRAIRKKLKKHVDKRGYGRAITGCG